jgi:hypothetical protein
MAQGFLGQSLGRRLPPEVVEDREKVCLGSAEKFKLWGTTPAALAEMGTVNIGHCRCRAPVFGHLILLARSESYI